MMDQERKVFFTKYGRFFGFPDCCVRSFIEDFSNGVTAKNREKRPLNGTGFIPCKQCAKKSENELTNIINANRIYKVPFPARPHTHQEVEMIKRKYLDKMEI